MNLLNKLTLKNLKLNQKRTIVTIIGIMLSVALITTVASIYYSGIASLISFEKERNGNYHVVYRDVAPQDISLFENNRMLENLNLTLDIGYAKISSKNEYKPYAFVKAFTPSSLENLAVRLVSGRLPENENELIIPTHLKTNGRLELKVGDSITLEVGERVDNEGYILNQSNPYTLSEDDQNGEKIINTVPKTYKIVGIFERPDYKIENYSAPGYTFITKLETSNLTQNVDIFVRYAKDGLKRFSQVTASILGIDEKIFDLRYSNKYFSDEELKQINEEFTKAKYQIEINDYLIKLETNPLSISSIGGLGLSATIVVLIIIFTSVFCIKNSFDISITEKIKQYGMLRSIGATKKQIKKNVFYEASILGVIGIPLGIVLGFIASISLIIISNYFLQDLMATGLKLKFVFSSMAVLAACILGALTIYLSAFRSANKAAKLSLIDSIKNSGNIKINRKKIKSPKLIKKIFGIGGDISYKNLKRNKKKYQTTVISIIVSVFVFIAFSSFMSMTFALLKNEINFSEINIRVSTTNYNEQEYEKLIETTTFDHIENYAIVRQSNIKISNSYYNQEYLEWENIDLSNSQDHYLSLIVLGDYQYQKYLKSLNLNYEQTKDKAILLDGGIISKYDEEKDQIVNKQIKIHNIQEKDQVMMTLSDDTNFEIEVAAVTNLIPFGLDSYSTGNIFIISDKLFDQLTTSRSIDIYYKSNDASKLQDEIDEALKGSDYFLVNREEEARMTKNLFILIGIFLYGFIIVISLIGITNIFNTITTNMELRKQEFAMLKSVGMTTKEFNRMIRLESLFMGLKSLAFGIPIGIALSYLIYKSFVSKSGMAYSLPLSSILIAIITVFILISFIMKYSISKIEKQNIIETIRNENI